MNDGGSARASLAASVAAGEMPDTSARAFTASGSVFSQVVNSTASLTCFDWLVTAVLDPPQLPFALSPAFHWGSGAAFHLPAVSGALPERTPAPHTAVVQPICVPLFRA